jgi:PAS domain S-box-containing protein
VGALCLDHRGPDRRWRRDEQVFVGSIADLVSLAIEASERRRAELALRESEVRYRELWENALDAMFTVSPDGLVTSLNEAGSRLLALAMADVLGRPFSDFLAPGEVAAAEAVFAGLVEKRLGAGDAYSFTLRRDDGRLSQVEATAQRVERGGELVEILAILRDVSQRRQLEAQLQQSQKMEAIGRLAGGVAHDFNNLLTAIIGYSQIAAMRPDMPPDAVVDLTEITAAAHRAAALTRQLLAFSRRQVLEPRVLDVNSVVSGIEVLLRRLIGEDYQLVADLDVEIAHVLADPGQLEQVILNLAVNARDAMPHGGRIVIRTRMAAALDPRALVSGESRTGPFVVLEVADRGTGMDEETRRRIFEPFFTTKASGTGLGLSTVYGIVQQSGGGIAVSSDPGRGSTFSVFLPVAAGNSVEGAAAPADMGPGGNETVLLVEDDELVRTLASRVLRLAGYMVLEAGDPRAALAIAGPQVSIDLVVTDLVLPYMRGRELVEHLRVQRPRLRVLYMSGYDDEDDGSGAQGEAFLPKPFTPDVLANAVRSVLDREPASR